MMIVRAFAVAATVVMTAGSAAFAVDQSARDTGPRGPVESCCVDTAMLPPLETSVAPDRHAFVHLNPSMPMSQARPGLDGADWNCRRPDGSQRCVSEAMTPH